MCASDDSIDGSTVVRMTEKSSPSGFVMVTDRRRGSSEGSAMLSYTFGLTNEKVIDWLKPADRQACPTVRSMRWRGLSPPCTVSPAYRRVGILL